MPKFRVTRALATRDLSGARVVCDGCDPTRIRDEHTHRASLWLVTSGVFELRDATGRHMLDPTQAIIMPGGHAFQIRHPAGPDVCLSLRGPIIDALAAHGPRVLRVSSALIAQIAAGAAEHDELALGEAIARLDPGLGSGLGSGLDPGLGSGDRRAGSADKDLSAAVAHVLRASYAESTSLDELSHATGYSVFHACRVFRATTGFTIHGFRRELRLHHALARIVGGGESLTEIAAATGFASQSHLTNLFRARFGVTPARARTRDGQRALRHVEPAAASLR